MRPYKYLFYTLYRWSSHWKHDIAPPEVNAFLGMIAIAWWNVLLLVELMECCVGVALIPKLSKTAIVIAMALLAAPQYFLLLYGRRYKGIVTEFKSESAHQRRIRATVVSSYIAVSFALLIAGAVIRSKVLGR
jgi:hypothetical protein